MDEKCDEFKSYLHSSGAMKALKEALASVYRLESWPANPIDFICQNLPCEQNETIAGLTNELEELRKIVEYLRSTVPKKESNENLPDEESKDIGIKVNENSNEHEPEIVLVSLSSDVERESEKDDPEAIEVAVELNQTTSQEDDETDQILVQEVDKQNELNDPNLHASEQKINETDESNKKSTQNRNKNRKNRKNRN